MVTPLHDPRSHCPINFGLEIFGDNFSLLILRDIVLHGKRRYSEFLAAGEGVATNILAARLQRLEAAGLVTRQVSAEDGRVVLYAPTAAAAALTPVLVELAYWGATHDPKTAAPASFVAAYRADREALIRAMTPKVEA